jgi:hypothetical protein
MNTVLILWRARLTGIKYATLLGLVGWLGGCRADATGVRNTHTKKMEFIRFSLEEESSADQINWNWKMGPPANNQRCEWNRVWCSKLTRLLRSGHSRFSRLDSHCNCQNHEGKRNHHRLAARCRRRHFSAKKIEFFVGSFVFCFKCSKIWFLSTKVHWVYIFYLNILCVFFFWLLTRVVRLVRCSSNIRYPRQTDTAHCSLSAISLSVYLSLFLFAPICQYETIGDVGLFLLFFFFFFMLPVDRLQDDAITPDEVRQSRRLRGTNGARLFQITNNWRANIKS